MSRNIATLSDMKAAADKAEEEYAKANLLKMKATEDAKAKWKIAAAASSRYASAKRRRHGGQEAGGNDST